tara:strand:- start:850 stop:1488 length:639 start_codon:yes stop_codon:yes gene_type:complete
MNTPSEIWKAIVQLYLLLYKGENKESTYQNYFENNDVVFKVLGMDRAISYEKSSEYKLPKDKERNYSYEPDFIGINESEGVVNIVDLKTPFVGSLTRSKYKGARVFFKQSANEYIGQATRYTKFIRGEREARERIKEHFGINNFSSYKIKLIYGLRCDNEDSEVEEILSDSGISTEIIFYDDVLDKLADAYKLCGRPVDTNDGWFFQQVFLL